MHFLDLPPELVCLIVICTNAKTIVQTRQICRIMKKIVDSSPELQYMIALHLHGFQDSIHSTGGLPVAERHERLTRYISERDAGRWSSEITFERHREDLWKSDQGYFVTYTKAGGMFTINRIPSMARGIEAREWNKRFGPPQTHVMSFTFDTSQDVLLVVTSSGIERDHSPIILHNQPFADSEFQLSRRLVLSASGRTFSDGRATVRVLGSIVGIVFNASEDNEDILLLVNWKTGEEIQHISSAVTSFTFLSPTKVLYPYALWDISHAAWAKGLAVFDVRCKRATFFRLPHAGRAYLSVSSGELTSSDGIFSPTPHMADQLIAVSITVSQRGGAQSNLPNQSSTMFFKASSLLDHLCEEDEEILGPSYTHPSFLASSEFDSEPESELPASYLDFPNSWDQEYTFVSWETWVGDLQSNPRIFHALTPERRIYIHGMRALLRHDEHTSMRLRQASTEGYVLDFTAGAVRSGDAFVPTPYSRNGRGFDDKELQPSTSLKWLPCRKLPLNVETGDEAQDRGRNAFLCEDGILIWESSFSHANFTFLTV